MPKYFDPHIHMVSRTTDDYQNMAAAGITGVIEPAFWQGQARTSVGSFIDYFDTLLGWERFRASMFGIHHFCTIGLNPKEANDLSVANEVLEILPRYLVKDGVVAVGEIGYDDITPEEDRFLAAQLELARQFNLPVLVHTPHRDKIGGTKRTLAVIREVGINENLVIIDHLNELTLPLVLDSDCWRGHSIYPNTKMSEQRMVALLQQYGTEKWWSTAPPTGASAIRSRCRKPVRPCWRRASARPRSSKCSSTTRWTFSPRAANWTKP